MKLRSRQRGLIEGVALYVIVGLGIALALSWAAAGAGFWWLDRKVEAANERATKAESARASEEQSRKGFQAAGEACGASVKALAAAGDARDRRWAEQLSDSAAKREKAEAEATALLGRGRKAGQSECDAMQEELNAEIDRRRPAGRP